MFKFLKVIFGKGKEIPNVCMHKDIVKQIFMQEQYVPPCKFAPPISPKYLPHKVVKPEYTTSIANLKRCASITKLNI